MNKPPLCQVGAPFLLHETLGCPIANLHSARSDLWEPQFVLRPTQLRKKAASLSLPQMALRLSGIKFLPPERTYSSLQIGKFPFAYRGLKIIPDFQRRPLKFLH
jgi:hypothetical protein